MDTEETAAVASSWGGETSSMYLGQHPLCVSYGNFTDREVEKEEEREEVEDWGYFSGGLGTSSDDDDEDEETEMMMGFSPTGNEEIRKKPKIDSQGMHATHHSNTKKGKKAKSKMFASSRFGGGGSCVCRNSIRYNPSNCASVKSVNCTSISSQQEPSVVACPDDNIQEGNYKLGLPVNLFASEPGLNALLSVHSDQREKRSFAEIQRRRNTSVLNQKTSIPEARAITEQQCGLNDVIMTVTPKISDLNHEKRKILAQDDEDLSSSLPSAISSSVQRSHSESEPENNKNDLVTQESNALTPPAVVEETQGRRLSRSSDRTAENEMKHESTSRRRGVRIEARVRKRRDDFCGDAARGGKTARWDVERWHVFAPRAVDEGLASYGSKNEYSPDRNGLILSPAFAPRVATRFFERGQDMSGLTVSFAMGSIRVVANGFERFAQYELVVQIDGGLPTSAWRRYSAFRALVSSVAAESAPRHIVRTLSAWADAQDAKKMFRCTHPAYLIQRYYHFEHVLREALFELQNPHLLLAFFSPEEDADHPDPRSVFKPETKEKQEQQYEALMTSRHAADASPPPNPDAIRQSPLDAAVSSPHFRLRKSDDVIKASIPHRGRSLHPSVQENQRPASSRLNTQQNTNNTIRRRRRHHSTPPALQEERPISSASSNPTNSVSRDDDLSRQTSSNAHRRRRHHRRQSESAAQPQKDQSHQTQPYQINPILAALLGVKNLSHRNRLIPDEFAPSTGVRGALRCY